MRLPLYELDLEITAVVHEHVHPNSSDPTEGPYVELVRVQLAKDGTLSPDILPWLPEPVIAVLEDSYMQGLVKAIVDTDEHLAIYADICRWGDDHG